MLYDKFAPDVFVYDFGCLYHKSKNTASRLPYIFIFINVPANFQA